MLTKDEFCILAKATVKQYKYGLELYDSVKDISLKYSACTDFIGTPEDDSILVDACSGILGLEFSYYMYDCDCDFDRYNNGVTLADGTHPNVHSFEDLYQYYVEEALSIAKINSDYKIETLSAFPDKRSGKLVRNSFHCKKCGKDVESKSTNHFASCDCGNFTDGGLDYIRRGGNFEDMEDTCIYE